MTGQQGDDDAASDTPTPRWALADASAPGRLRGGGHGRRGLRRAPRGGTFEYAHLTYEMGSAGQATAVRVVRSSGDADFDRAQAATLRQCRFSFPAGVDPAGAAGSAVLVPLRPSVPGEMPSTARLDGPVITHVRSCAPSELDHPAAMRYAREQGTSQLRFTVAPPGVLQFGESIASNGAGMLHVVALTKLSSVPARHHMDVSYIWRMQ